MSLPLGYACIIAAALSLGANSIFVKILFDYGIAPGEVLVMQYVIAVVLFWTAAAVKRDVVRISRRSLYNLMVLGLFGTSLTALLFYYALDCLGAGLATMLLFTFPAYVVVMAALFFKERVGAAKTLSLLFTLAGSAMALNVFDLGLGEISPAGIVLGLGAALGCAFINVFSQHVLREVRPVTVSLYATTFAVIPLLFLYNPMALIGRGLSPEVVCLLVLAALLATFLPTVLMFAGIKAVGAAKASIVGAVELPFTVVLAFAFLGERILTVQFFGAALIFSAVLLLYGDRGMPPCQDRNAVHTRDQVV